jgi:thioredoxin-related protein
MLPPSRAALAALAVLIAASACPAQQVQWRTDYNTARREAVEKDRPLFIDFSTTNCFFCKKLDAGPFRDPALIALLNDRFIPLKLDGERETTLVQALRIQAYPTLVMAGADGKILGVIEGFLEAPRLTDHLQRALQAASTSDWMARDFQEATRSVAAADYGRAVTLLKGIDKDGKDRPVQVKAREVLRELEQQAAGQLARVRQMQEAGQNLEAVEVLTGLMKKYPGTQAAGDGSQLLTALADKPEQRQRQREQRARDLLASAREDYRGGSYAACLERCDVLAGQFDDLPEGKEGSRLAADVRANPEMLAKACAGLSERLADLYMAQADGWAKKGDRQKAADCLEQAVRACPGSARAELAQGKLAQLQGREARLTNFSKP